jgi:hypothetical protein
VPTIQRHKNTIYGLNADLLALQNSDAAEATARANAVTALQTSIADAVAAAAAATAAEAATRATADTALQTAITQEAADRAAAITAAQLALGSNYTVADHTAKDALTGLTVSDRVLVEDDGDGKWALYQTSVVTTGAGATSTFVKLSDQDALTNAISATSIKAAYESNADTNAFTDTEKAKVGFVTATSAIDLDKVVQNDELLTSVTLTGASDTAIPSALAVKTFVQEATRVGGSVFKTESLTVTADKIVLTETAKDGVILNFATVRHIDGNGIAYDIPVSKDGADATGKTFILSPDTTGEFDTKSVLVQYPYVLAA